MNRQRDLLSGIWGGLALTSGVALTATSGWLIVRASERPVILTLLTAIVGVRAFGMARPFFRHLERVRSHDVALADLAERRTEVYAGLIPLTPARLGRRSRSSVLSGVVDDLTDVVEAHVRVRVPVISAVLAAGATIALTGALLPVAGVVVAAWIALVVVVAALGLRLERTAQTELGLARAEVSRAAELVTRHTSELRAIGAAGDVLTRLDRAHAGQARALRRQSRGRALVTFGTLVLTGAATIAMAAIAVGASDISAGVAALLVVVPAALADALLPLADAMRAQARAEESTTRIEALLDQEPAVRDAADTRPGERAVTSERAERGELVSSARDSRAEPGEWVSSARVPHLRIEGVTAGWVDGRVDVGPVDLDLAPGRRVALVGANGSGKSTLLAVIARALDPASGRYLLDGADVTTLPLEDVRSLLAIMDDEPHVFATSVRANLVLAAPDATDDEVLEALRIAGLGDWFDALPEGLDTQLGTGGRGLSGGERARLALARAVLSKRPVVLLDEPVAQLDHPTATRVMADVWSALDGRTVVVVSHRDEGLDHADQILDLTSKALVS